MKWLNKFMQGRAGGDQFSVFLLLLSVFITLTGRIAGIALIEMFSYLPLIFGVYRIFSKNIQQRRMENHKFMIKFSPIYQRLYRRVIRFRYSKTHKMMPCTSCKTMLRFPKNKGKIKITCPRCNTKFTRRT